MRKFLLMSVCICTSVILNGQNAVTDSLPSWFEFSIGAGAPESINAKLKCGGRFQVGVFAGWLPEAVSYRNDETFLGADMYFHFEKSKVPDRFKYYLNTGIAKSFPENQTSSGNVETLKIILFARLGRAFNINQKVGINLDLGVMFKHVIGTDYYSPMYTARYGYKVAKGSYDSYDPYPAASVSFFVRF